MGLADMVFGSSATLIAAIGSYLLRGKPALVPLPPVMANGIIIGIMLYQVYGVSDSVVCKYFVGCGRRVNCLLWIRIPNTTISEEI